MFVGRMVISISYSSVILKVLPFSLTFNLLVLEGLLQRWGMAVQKLFLTHEPSKYFVRLYCPPHPLLP